MRTHRPVRLLAELAGIGHSSQRRGRRFWRHDGNRRDDHDRWRNLGGWCNYDGCDYAHRAL